MSNDCSKIPDKHVSNRDRAHANSLLILKAKEQAKIEAYPFLDILEMLSTGTSQGEMAKVIGCNRATVSIFLASRTGDAGKAVQEAKKASGVACFDRALQELEQVRGTESAVDVALAKELARHWEKRGAIFDRQLHDRGELPSQQANNQTLPPSFSITILNGSSNQTVTIQQDADLI